MKRHISYLKYVIRHKWFVFIAALRCNCSLWQALIHDWHKFLPSEWNPYASTFYKPDGSKQYIESTAFAIAWNFHQKRGKHHWQYWLLTWDRGTSEPVPMPTKYVREMVADWWGAGRAITGKWAAPEWFTANRQNMKLHPETDALVQHCLSTSKGRFTNPTITETVTTTT